MSHCTFFCVCFDSPYDCVIRYAWSTVGLDQDKMRFITIPRHCTKNRHITLKLFCEKHFDAF